ncbi:carboxymuconolactone decarboxylase family protein [Microlunatus sp. GCM10028923]|uniref:carboxymuconolactone decarboxylase family protein n=1 Tax=Microlunatus sp. GCM10028923 TaxID=3273400 RepID=UPI0036207904
MHLAEPPEDADVRALYDSDLVTHGYVMNLTRLWAWQPDVFQAYLQARSAALEGSGLTDREIALLVVTAATTRRDSYCSLAWGARLAQRSDVPTAVAVLGGESGGLDEREAALVDWARGVAGDPNGTTAADVERLRAAGFEDRQILALTVFVALRLAFSTVNDALGAPPDRELADAAPAPVLAAVDFGRPVAGI